MRMRGLTTIEWLVIAVIVLVAASQVIRYWDSIWQPLKAKTSEKADEFGDAIADLKTFVPDSFTHSLSLLPGPPASYREVNWS